MKKIKTLLIFSFLISQITWASDWSSNSVTLLKGDDFSVGSDRSRVELTFESASKFMHGDSFFWVDITNPSKKSNEDSTSGLYGEWSPRLSLVKLLQIDLSEGIIKDIMFSNTFEFGNSAAGQTRANLHGFGLDFDFPHFLFFQWNLYIRDNLDVPGTTTQSTIAYKLPFSLGESWLFDWSGFVDIVHGDEGEKVSESYVDGYVSSGQQLKLDIGSFYGEKGVLFTGLEYQYWKNKYGIVDGEPEYNLKYFVQWYL